MKLQDLQQKYVEARRKNLKACEAEPVDVGGLKAEAGAWFLRDSRLTCDEGDMTGRVLCDFIDHLVSNGHLIQPDQWYPIEEFFDREGEDYNKTYILHHPRKEGFHKDHPLQEEEFYTVKLGGEGGNNNPRFVDNVEGMTIEGDYYRKILPPRVLKDES